MANLRFLLVAAIAAACSAGAPAQAQSSPAVAATVSTGVPVYQGVAFVTAYTDATAGACENAGLGVGSYVTITYRELVELGNTTYGGGFGNRQRPRRIFLRCAREHGIQERDAEADLGHVQWPIVERRPIQFHRWVQSEDQQPRFGEETGGVRDNIRDPDQPLWRNRVQCNN